MPEDFQPIELVEGDFSKGLLLLCDHARNALPSEYGSLGLPSDQLKRHIAYDIGAEGIFKGLAERLDVPGVMTTYSRLLIDPNRGLDDPTLIRQLYDGTIIPGNYPLSYEELQKRIDAYYLPYHRAITETMDQFKKRKVVPCVLSIHSMTDKWNGEKRPWEISVLWDSDPRLAKGLQEELKSLDGMTIGNNVPYDGALGGDTMFSHCTKNGFSHALLEFRQDLVSSQSGIDHFVNLLAPIIEKLNRLTHNHEVKFFGTRTNSPLD